MREHASHMRGAQLRLDREHESARWHVWHAAALARVEKFPDFKDFGAPKIRKTPEELLAVAMMWHAQISNMESS